MTTADDPKPSVLIVGGLGMCIVPLPNVDQTADSSRLCRQIPGKVYSFKQSRFNRPHSRQDSPPIGPSSSRIRRIMFAKDIRPGRRLARHLHVQDL